MPPTPEQVRRLFEDDEDETVQDSFPWEESIPNEDNPGEYPDPGEYLMGDEDFFVEDSYPAKNTVGSKDEPPSTQLPADNTVGGEHELPTNDDAETMLNVGDEFDGVDELLDAYQEHARRRGFAVTKRTTKKKNGLMVCNRARTTPANKTTKRIGCKARLNYRILNNGRCEITSIHHDHNHELNPAYSVLMPAHRRMGIHLRRQLEANDTAGLRPCKNIRLLEVQAGGPQNIGCTSKDCRNFIDQRRRMRLGEGDAEAIRKMFMRLQLQDPNFFYLMDIDSDSRLRHILWIHPRCRTAYQEFHDVVSFDTTYLVNRYNMPFASVVGVNHHGYSILLGCALLSNEEAETFKWFFSNWLIAMGGIPPYAIITDQCGSIKKAIRDVMPDAIHRFCIWHILEKLPKKLGGRIANYKKCTNELKAIVYESLDIQTFESDWRAWREKWGLRDNAWLEDLYTERESWVPVYLHHTFWAGMMSTQRSESMHSFFDEFIHSMSTLKQFMEHYDMAIANKVQKEFKADYDSSTTQITRITHFAWEKQFQAAYTNEIFKLVQEQIKRMIYCHVVHPAGLNLNDPVNSEIETFSVLERSILNHVYKQVTYTVEWRPNGSYITCNCKKFEFRGILCCHIMKILAQKDIRTVHERYVLNMWKKTLHRPHSKIFFAGGYPHMTEEYKKFQEVEKSFLDCMDFAMGNAEKLAYVKELLDGGKRRLSNWEEANAQYNEERSPNNVRADVGGSTLLEPNVVRRRGRPPVNRQMSAVEIAVRQEAARGRGRGSGRGDSPARGGGRGDSTASYAF